MPWKAGRHRIDAVACSPYINYLHPRRILFLVTFTEQHNTCTSHSCKDSYCGQAYRTGGRNIRGVWFGRWRYRRFGAGRYQRRGCWSCRRFRARRYKRRGWWRCRWFRGRRYWWLNNARRCNFLKYKYFRIEIMAVALTKLTFKIPAVSIKLVTVLYK